MRGRGVRRPLAEGHMADSEVEGGTRAPCRARRQTAVGPLRALGTRGLLRCASGNGRAPSGRRAGGRGTVAIGSRTLPRPRLLLCEPLRDLRAPLRAGCLALLAATIAGCGNPLASDPADYGKHPSAERLRGIDRLDREKYAIP